MRFSKQAKQQIPGAIAKLLKVGKFAIEKMVEFEFVWMVVVEGCRATFVSKRKILAIIELVALVTASEDSKAILHSVLGGHYRTNLQLGKLLKIHTATIAAWRFNTEMACKPLNMSLNSIFSEYFGYHTVASGGWAKAE